MADTETKAPKEVQPMTLEAKKDDGSPMTMNRPDWVASGAPVGQLGLGVVEPSIPDPSVINQPSSRGDVLAQPGTPDTIDPETGYETNTTSVAMLAANEERAKAEAQAAKDAAKGEKSTAKATDKEDASYEANNVEELKAELDRRKIEHASSLNKPDLIKLLEDDDKGKSAPKTEGGSKP
jgi:hypothetical protein